MSHSSTDQLNAALQRCNEEPIHIPGVVQPCGVLLGIDRASEAINYVSDTASQFFQIVPEQLFGTQLVDLIGREAMHDLRNVQSRLGARPRRDYVGLVTIADTPFHMSVSPSDGAWSVEFEPLSTHGEDAQTFALVFPALMDQIQNAATVSSLFEMLLPQLSSMSHYDRVMLYRFDADWNGEVIAEEVAGDLEPYLGLRFPHWDIPVQARSFMLKFPVRYVSEASATQSAILPAPGVTAPLDITYAQLRGTSAIHLQYLQNMDVEASMTLSIVVDAKLWGIISFHNRRPKIPSFDFRRLCEGLVPLLNTKLFSLLQSQTLDLHDEIDRLRLVDLKNVSPNSTLLKEAEDSIAVARDRLKVDGVVLGIGDEMSSFGVELPEDILARVRKAAQASDDGVWFSDCLAEAIEVPLEDLGEASGAICLDRNDGRWMCLIRKSRDVEVSWAGAPSKEVDTSDGMARLNPRGSFSLYRETVRNTSRPWLKQDVDLLSGIALRLLAADQRKLVLTAMRRQQELVVDELNHRVRNILSLVRSISRQARKTNASLDSYTLALEQRMNALAKAHDLGATDAHRPVSVQEIIQLEAAPHSDRDDDAVFVSGDDAGLVPDAAPIFALVVHELMTNAAKYGALSTSQGRVMISMQRTDEGLSLHWIEVGGPPVVPVNERGFGMNLIDKAIPYELSGTSQVTFNPTGLTAHIKLPKTILTENQPPVSTPKAERPVVPADASSQSYPHRILVVEDNFMIALDMISNLKNLGFEDAELAGNQEQAKRLIEHQPVDLVILDVNLGRNGTSIEFAQELQGMDKPFFFVSGYGEDAPMPSGLDTAIKLTKPVELADLRRALQTVLELGGGS